ncbi:1765_t:CDS:2 [Rhizophagus irregularis]|nr:1765_t:CDS:2 [Rhizophagus irregularis]
MSTSTSNIRDKIIESIKHFSEIKQLEIEDKVIQNELEKISEQEEKFRDFAKDYDQRLSNHADDLITFAECCEEDNISSDELLVSLKKLSDAKLNKSSVFLVGVAAIAAVPFTAGASLAILPVKLIVTISSSLIVHGAATAVVSTIAAGTTTIQSKILNSKLKGIREQISRLLQEIQKSIQDINTIISHCDSHFEEQIAEIEEVEKIVDIFKKLDDRNGRQLIKPIARTISTRARKNSESYSVDMRQVLKRDSGFYDCYVCEEFED